MRLWGERAPGTAAKAVQGYVSHLRRVLEPGDGEERRPRHATARLRAAARTTRPSMPRASSASRQTAGAHSRTDQRPRRPALLDQALALWRGPALAEFAFEDFARDEIGRLDDLRLSATEDRVESLLRSSAVTASSVGKLDALVAANPLRERLRGQSMLALYRSGRQSDALQVYRDGRRLLAGELGLEPGPELQRLERAILAQDPALEAPAPVARRALARRARRAAASSCAARNSRRLLALAGVRRWSPRSRGRARIRPDARFDVRPL